MDRNVRYATETRVIRITEVNTTNRMVIGSDDYGTTVYVSMHLLDPVLVLPKPGEYWLVDRAGSDWLLSKRIDPESLQDLNPGDVKIAGETIHLKGDVLINGSSPVLSIPDFPTEFDTITLTGNTKNTLNFTGANAGLTIGDTNLYRSTTNVLQSDSHLKSVLRIEANTGTSNAVVLGHNVGGIAAGLNFGGDTNLYRVAVDQLRTDDFFEVVHTNGIRVTTGGFALRSMVSGEANSRFVVAASGAISWGPGTAAQDTTLYRSAADVLKTDDTFDAIAYRINGVSLASTHLSDSSSLARLASPSLTGTPTAPTAAADTNTTQLATTAYVVGQAGATSPTMNGTTAIGTSLRYARQDHVHPIDTSRAPLASPTFTGTPAAPTPTVGDNSTRIATTAFVLANAVMASGTLASRPAANAVSSGSTYFATDQVVIYRSNGTSWIRMSEPAGLGGVWYTATAPTGYLLLQGQAWPGTTGIYADLFALLGGANLPDMRQRTPVGWQSGDADFGTLLAGTGVKTHTLTAGQMPNHSHTVNSHNHGGGNHGHNFRWDTGGDGVVSYPQGGYNSGYWMEQPQPITASGVIIASESPGTDGRGNNEAHPNIQPSRVVNFIAKL
jgi:microcystin-dependent protein